LGRTRNNPSNITDTRPETGQSGALFKLLRPSTTSEISAFFDWPERRAHAAFSTRLP
jgi:hypothetical protein